MRSREHPLLQCPSFRTRLLPPGVECIVIALFRGHPIFRRPLLLVTPQLARRHEMKGDRQAKFLKRGRNAPGIEPAPYGEGKRSRSNTRFYENAFASSSPVEIDYQYLRNTCLYRVMYHHSIVRH